MWDDVADKQKALSQIYDRLETSLAQVRGVPVVPISGMYGRGFDKLKAVEDVSCYLEYAYFDRQAEQMA